MEDFNNTVNQLDLKDIYTTPHKTVEYTFFSRIQEHPIGLDRMVGQKTSLNKFKRTEIMQNVLSNHNGMKSEISKSKKNFGNCTCT